MMGKFISSTSRKCKNLIDLLNTSSYFLSKHSDEKPIAIILEHEGAAIRALHFSWDGKYLVSVAEDRRICVFDKTKNFIKVKECDKIHDGIIRTFAISPNNKYISSGSKETKGKQLAIYDFDTKQKNFRPTYLNGHISSIWFDFPAQ